MNSVRGTNSELSVTVLHVSDPQFGQYHRFGPSDSLGDHLTRDVPDLNKMGVPPIDLVIVSGDIAERGKRPEYEQARSFLDQVCRSTGLGRERVVVVPGNHDVSWDLSSSYFSEWRDEHHRINPSPAYGKEGQPYAVVVTTRHDPT